MNVRTTPSALAMILAVICCCITAPLSAQNSGRPLDQANQEGKPVVDLSGGTSGSMDIAAKNLPANRRGIFSGIDLNTYNIIISGREYKGGVHEIPVVIGQQLKPLYELSANTPIRFHVDSEGIVRAVWVDGELSE